MKKKMQSRSAKGRFQIQEEEPIMLTKSTDPAVRPSTPLAYAQSACDTMIRRYAAADLPPKGHFHYHQGVFLSGVYKTYQLCGNEAYFSYMKDWSDSVFTEDGRIKNDYKHGDLDDIQPGILLFPLLEKTGDEKYRKCIEFVAKQLPDVPLCKCGGLYHKVSLTGQMWLDGLYMAGPFAAEYARKFNHPEWLDFMVKEIFLMRDHTRVPETGLWRHAWDETKTADWCDPETGLAPEYWGRSLGWVPVAVMDVLDQMKPEDAHYDKLRALVKDLLTSLLKYQSADGRWYQVIDKADQPGNWPENSCTCLFVAALSKAVRQKILPESALDAAKKGYEGVIRSLNWEGNDLLIGKVCVGTGVGSYDFYCGRPCSTNDLHGVGAFLLMCTELHSVLAS